ncbi:MAG TPA: alternate F1F0 ATPase, F1 subunit alpha [Acidobacteriota bacterium]|nr:alternate F1F0 ATPase, F1 subunit alpha [Acidobacteriota bacterium]
MSPKNKNKNNPASLDRLLEQTESAMARSLGGYQAELSTRETGRVFNVGKGVARIRGLSGVKYEELLRFPGHKMGIAFNLDEDEVAAVLLDEYEYINSGDEVRRTHRVVDIPVGEELVGRVVDPLGRPLDRSEPIRSRERWPIERKAPPIMHRSPVEVPLQTGLQVVDALIPVGRGQRELILGDRQIGKTAVALDTIINQKDKDVICVYCTIGKESASTAKMVADLKRFNSMDYTIVVSAHGEDPPGFNFIAPYAATTMAEYFMEKGKDVLIVYDDLTRHARSYRELSLLLRRPPAREAYPGDIFYIHSRLLERSTHLREEYGGGSLTAFPIIETQAENISAYIPTNLVSITDGQIYLSPKLFGEGILPAVDVGKSVSRVGGKTQLPAYRAVAGDLRLSYSQYKELETFARFGTRLDEETRKTLERGRRVREVLKQPQYKPISVAEQMAVLLAVSEGKLDPVPLSKIAEAKKRIQDKIRDRVPEVARLMESGEKLEEKDKSLILSEIDDIISDLQEEE